MWEQSWIVSANSEHEAHQQVQDALASWAPKEAGIPSIGPVRLYRGPDDLAVADAIAEDLAAIRQTVAQSHRQELSRRLQHLTHRALGIPPKPGFVVLDQGTPRSPRPGDLRAGNGLRWLVSVSWPGDVPDVH